MRHTAGHCNGYAVRLWKVEGKLRGLLLACAGIEGDTPTGLLDDLQWNSENGALTFTARLTVGSDITADGDQVPSRDRFQFQGKLGPEVLNGTLRRVDLADPDAPHPTMTISLKKIAEMPQPYPTKEDWQAAVTAILKLRGPKW
jgi:hypothetical protein